MSELKKSELVALAKNCSENYQYVNAIAHMRDVIRMGFPLNINERELIYESFNGLKAATSEILEDGNKIDEKLESSLIINAKEAICDLCKDAIYFLEENPVEKDISREAVADHKHFKAMQYKDLAAYTTKDSNENYKNKALELFEEAMEDANKYLNPAHPVRIQIALSLSQFHYFVLDNFNDAYEIASEAYDEGCEEVYNMIASLKDAAEFWLHLLMEHVSYLIDIEEIL